MKTNDDDFPHLFVPEGQNILVELFTESVYQKYGDYYVLIGQEYAVKQGKNMGNVVVGILKKEIEDGQIKYSTIFPFTEKIIYAKFLNAKDIKIVRYVDHKLENTCITLNQEGRINEEDLAFLYKESLKRVRVETCMI